MRKAMATGMLLLAGCTGDPVERELRDAASSDPAARRLAVESLAQRQDPRALPVLVRATRDPDRDVRCAAATALRDRPADLAIPPLLDMLAARHPGHDCTFDALAGQEDARAIAPLLAEYARTGDARALAAVGNQGPAVVAPLVNVLRREADPHRAEALARTLVAAGGARAFEPLRQLHAEYDRLAQANAVLGLGVLGDRRALPMVSKAADAGIGTAPLALARIGGAGLDNLVARLDSPRLHERNAAVAALGQARDPVVVPLLQAALVGNSPSAAEGAARALLALAGPPSPGAAEHPLRAPASEALEAAWTRKDLRTIALGVDHFLARHPDSDDEFLEAIAAHGDERLAAAYANSSSEMLRAAAAQWRAQQSPVP